MGWLGRSKQQAQEAPYSFQDRFQQIRRIVIIYPEKTVWLRIARYALQHLYLLPEPFEFLLLVPADMPHPELFVDHEYISLDYNLRSEAQTALIDRISAFKPDLLMQLEPQPGERLNQLVKALKIQLKVGLGSESSGLNVVYSMKPTDFYEKNILNLIALLKVE